ncbi:MAG: sulfite exporter TauE/SafE family protein [Marinilabiliaceae bacterium]
MTVIDAILLIAAGLVAGIINTLAGSGSLITLPLLMFMGLPPAVANGTNRIGVIIQNAVATHIFIRQKELHAKKEWHLIVPALVGALAGALIAVDIKEDVLNYFIGGLLIVMFFVILLKPDRWIKGKAGQTKSRRSRIINSIIFFLIGIYGGFIQAGVGLFLLAGLVLGAGHNLIRANAVKVLAIMLFNIIALLVFIQAGKVAWSYGLLLAAGSAAGGWIASRYASRIGPQRIRYLLLAVVLVAGLKVLGVF